MSTGENHPGALFICIGIKDLWQPIMGDLMNPLAKTLGLAIAALSGLAMAVQGCMNSALSKAVGLSQGTFLVHASATLGMILILVLGGGKKGNLGNYTQVPWYYFLGGLLGIAITYGVVVSIPKLGASTATTAIIVGQVLTACLLDHFGLFGLNPTPMTWLKGAGLVLLAVGAKFLLG